MSTSVTNSRQLVRSVTGAACVNPSGLRPIDLRLSGNRGAFTCSEESYRQQFSAVINLTRVIDDESKALSSLVARESHMNRLLAVAEMTDPYTTARKNKSSNQKRHGPNQVSTKTKTTRESPAWIAVIGLLAMFPSFSAASGFSWLVRQASGFKISDLLHIGKRLLLPDLPRPPVACILIIIIVLFTGPGCRRSGRDASEITLTLIDQSWADKGTQRRLNEELDSFTKQTGVRVQVLPSPEGAVEQLAAWRKLLESGAEVRDVYAIDVIWPGILANNLLDLKAYVSAEEIAAYFPKLIASYTVNGKLVALPYNMSMGMLFYRNDLLRKYGYDTPPKTWDELKVMARRIQAGERAKGNKDFWGFVWEGAPSEALTCNALEWQVSDGGGTILDEDGRVTVNNPQAIHAWSRAARWVGTISPPGVIAYKEWDAFNIWQAGNAAFMRNWTSSYVAARAQDSPTRDRFDVAPLPRGSAGVGATLGGNG